MSRHGVRPGLALPPQGVGSPRWGMRSFSNIPHMGDENPGLSGDDEKDKEG